ncbi:unnamed protein product [Meloidogyne enterolobii]|uniref:Uncharacterized protein n=1 Tax=Meloidogyne enterolobii TaxID=390850 RepID=A0ACB0YWR7_MELEN
MFSTFYFSRRGENFEVDIRGFGVSYPCSSVLEVGAGVKILRDFWEMNDFGF